MFSTGSTLADLLRSAQPGTAPPKPGRRREAACAAALADSTASLASYLLTMQVIHRPAARVARQMRWQKAAPQLTEPPTSFGFCFTEISAFIRGRCRCPSVAPNSSHQTSRSFATLRASTLQLVMDQQAAWKDGSRSMTGECPQTNPVAQPTADWLFCRAIMARSAKPWAKMRCRRRFLTTRLRPLCTPLYGSLHGEAVNDAGGAPCVAV